MTGIARIPAWQPEAHERHRSRSATNSGGPAFAAALGEARGAGDPELHSKEIALKRLAPLLTSQLLEQMLPRERKTDGSGLASDTWRSMLARELGDILANRIGSDTSPTRAAPPTTLGDRR